MDEVRSWFEVPAIAHFFHVFKDSFDLIEFEIEDFEEALFLDSAENVSSFLPDLVIRLLRGLYKTKDGLQVTMENYNNYLQDLLHYRYVTLREKENPIAKTNFKGISTRTKIDVIYDMCNWRLEMEDAMELTKNLEAEEMRTEPVGIDADGNVYWYFYGTRLYKETVLNRNVFNGSDIEDTDQPHPKPKAKKRKKKKKEPAKTTKYGRAVKKRKLDYSSQEDEETSEEETDEDIDDLGKQEIKDEKLTNGTSNHNNDARNPWCVQCSTMQQWEEFLQSFKASKNKYEKCLYKSLLEYMDFMPRLFTEKEKALQKKLLAMAPRRASDRIQLKVQQRELEERMHEQERLLKSQQKAQEAEQRQKELKKEKEMEREKRYKEREKNLEQRALRAKQREELKLVAENPELAKELQLANKEKTYQTMTFDLEGEEDDKYFAMEKVLNVLKDHDDAWPFLEPVDESEAPNYYTFIENPMDLSKIGEKIKKKEYKDKHEFESDVLLIIDNCETYNGTYSPFTKLAFKLKKVFDKIMKREFPPEVDYSDDLYEEKDQVKLPKAKKPKIENEKTPKEKKPKKEKKTSLQKLQSYKTMITPEFAHAQILQAKLQQGQLQSGDISSAPQTILPKLGIPQDILAKMSPAQLQMFMLQYRAGAFPGFNKKPSLLLPSQKVGTVGNQNTASGTVDPASQSLYKLAGAAASLSPLNISKTVPGGRSTVTPVLSTTTSAVNLMNTTGGIAPKKLELSQLLTMQNNLPKAGGVTVFGRSPLLQGSISKNTPILQGVVPKLSPAAAQKSVLGVGSGTARNLKLSTPASTSPANTTSKLPYVPTTMLPAGISWETVKNSLKIQQQQQQQQQQQDMKSILATAASSIAVTTAVTNARTDVVRKIPLPAAISSVRLAANQVKGKHTLLASNIGIRSATPTTIIRTQLPSVSTQGVNTIIPTPSPGRLIIRGRSGKVAAGSTPVLKKVGVPLMNSTVRFIGRPDGGQVKKILMVPSSSIPISGKGQVGIVSAGNVIIGNQTGLIRQASTSKVVSIPIGISPTTSAPTGALVAQPIRMKVPLSIQQPVYIASQGIPLQLIKPDTAQIADQSVTLQPKSSSVILLSKTITTNASALSAQYTTQNSAAPVLISSMSTSSKHHVTGAETAQNLHGLKKAIQQIAAVNQISSKLQNHLQESNSKSSVNASNNSLTVAAHVKYVNSNVPNYSNSSTVPPLAIIRGVGGETTSSSGSSTKSTSNTLVVPAAGSKPLQGSLSSSTNVVSAGIDVPPLMSKISTNVKIESDVKKEENDSQSPPCSLSDVNSYILTSNGLICMNAANSQQHLPNSKLVMAVKMKDTGNAKSPLILKQQNIIASNAPVLNNNLLTVSSIFPSHIARTQSITSSIIKSSGTGYVASVVTPEKLRDAEALLGLIDPSRLKSSIAATTTPTRNINSRDSTLTNGKCAPPLPNSLDTQTKNVGNGHTMTPLILTSTIPNVVCTTGIMNTPFSGKRQHVSSESSIVVVSSSTACHSSVNSSATVSITGATNARGVVPLKIPLQVPVSMLKFGSVNNPSVVPKSPANIVNSARLKSPVKIQLPGSSPGNINFGTIKSSNIVVSPVKTTNIPTNEKPVLETKRNPNDGTNNSLVVGKTRPTSVTSPVAANKMFLDQAQIRKLQSEGRLAVTPSGQMFLLTQPVSTTK